MLPKKHHILGIRPKNSQGFILLEVLIAMSLILGAWVTSVEAYQRLALKLAQQEAKRLQLRKELDVFETQERVRANSHLPSKSVIHESARMSGRNRSMRTTTQSIIKNQR